MWAFSNRLADADALLERKLAARLAFEEMFREHADSFSGRTAEHADIRLRNQLFTELIDRTLAGPPDETLDGALVDEVSDDGAAQTDEFLDVVVAEELAFSERATAGTSV